MPPPSPPSNPAKRCFRPAPTRACTGPRIGLCTLLLLLFGTIFSILHTSLASARQLHTRFPITSSPEALHRLASLSQPETLTTTGSTLSPFLIPRVSGTEGNKKVQEYLISTFTTLGWHVEQDSFNDTTPYGVKPFNNIIVTKDPLAKRRLVLAAHFDSKYFEGFDFIGATDSAVPCAILVDVATSLNSLLDDHMAKLVREGDDAAHPPTLQLIFFDGEEAFREWSSTDSLYGARHLAEKWANTYATDGGRGAGPWASDGYMTELSRIDVFVLLDLLGTAETTIYNTHADTTWMWNRLVDIQSRIAKEKLASTNLSGRLDKGGPGYFMDYFSYGGIEDDHKPFAQRGVPVVHCIAQPFPHVWHTINDNASAISADAVRDYALIFRVLVVEYLGLIL